MNQTTTQSLAISILGKDEAGATHEIAKLATHCSCTIKESRMTTLGQEFGLLLLVCGSWDAIAKFENGLPMLSKRHEWHVAARRTNPTIWGDKLLPYTVQVIALDNIGLIQQITGFFADQQISIREMFSTTYPASHTGTLMFSLTMSVNIPSSVQLSDLRERFILFCDDLNLDAIIEPEKS